MLAFIDMQHRPKVTPTSKYTCKACHSVFVREDRFLAHYCKHMKRQDDFNSPDGQAAWIHYQTWMRKMNRIPPSSGLSFMSSKYFRTFINFTEYVRKVSLPNVDKFIWLMVQKDFPPTLWVTNDAYEIYLEFLDHKLTPMEQTQTSIKTLIKVAEKHEVDLAEVFTKLGIPDLIRMLQTRQLSPWLLLHSAKFKEIYRNQCSMEQKMIMGTLIKGDFWAQKIEDNPESVEKIKLLVSEMGI